MGDIRDIYVCMQIKMVFIEKILSSDFHAVLDGTYSLSAIWQVFQTTTISLDLVLLTHYLNFVMKQIIVIVRKEDLIILNNGTWYSPCASARKSINYYILSNFRLPYVIQIRSFNLELRIRSY